MEGNKKLDGFIKKTLKEIDLDQPSFDFTKIVISRINEVQAPPVYQHKPLLSKVDWGVILALVVAVFTYVFFGNITPENTFLSLLKLNRLTVFNLSGKMPDLPFLNTFMYGFLSIAFFVWIQILVFQRYFNKQYLRRF